MPRKLCQRVFGEYVGNPSHSGVNSDSFTVGGGNTGAFLAAMLEGKKCKKGKAGYIFIRGINAENSARLVQDLPAFKYVLSNLHSNYNSLPFSGQFTVIKYYHHKEISTSPGPRRRLLPPVLTCGRHHPVQ
jgi:hypothetical protein